MADSVEAECRAVNSSVCRVGGSLDGVNEALDDLGSNIGQVEEDLSQGFKRMHGHLEAVVDELAGDSSGCATTS